MDMTVVIRTNTKHFLIPLSKKRTLQSVFLQGLEHLNFLL